MNEYTKTILAEADKVIDTVDVKAPTFTDYRGLDPVAGVEILLTVHSDGHREARTRPVGADGWTAWGPPVSLVADPTFGGLQ